MINIREHNEFVRDAALQGQKLEIKHPPREVIEMDNEQKEKIAQVHRDAIKRKFEEKMKRNSNVKSSN